MTELRWSERATGAIRSRAFREAQDVGVSWCGVEHALLAILDPPAATDALAVLSELGLTRARAEELFQNRWEGLGESSKSGVSTNPAFHSLMGAAQGIAIGFGADEVTDEHLLLALAYRGKGQLPSLLDSLGIDRDALVRALAARGQRVPAVLPPPIPPPLGPIGPWVYFPATDHSNVTRAMIERFPPGTAHWGFNVSTWKPGLHWINAEESCNAAEVIRAAARDASLVHEIPIDVAGPAEAAARQ